MPDFKPGDFVSVLNEPIYGTVVQCLPQKCIIRDTDGFEREYLSSKLVRCNPPEHYKLSDDLTGKDHQPILKKISKTLAAEPIERRLPFELDLHYEALAGKIVLQDPHLLLQKQMSACRAFVQKAIHYKTKRIVLIHGKGSGSLRAEIHLYLTRLESHQGIRLKFGEADFNEYGGGATEVIFEHK